LALSDWLLTIFYLLTIEHSLTIIFDLGWLAWIRAVLCYIFACWRFPSTGSLRLRSLRLRSGQAGQVTFACRPPPKVKGQANIQVY
jgi:hypothetical protein